MDKANPEIRAAQCYDPSLRRFSWVRHTLAQFFGLTSSPVTGPKPLRSPQNQIRSVFSGAKADKNVNPQIDTCNVPSDRSN